MPRFATQAQLDYVAAQEDAIEAYHQKLLDVVTYVAGLIEAACPDSGIETRLISGEGRDDGSWLGNLRTATPGDDDKVDVWCLTITNSRMLPNEQNEVGNFNKEFGLGVDYHLDYDFGTDETNTEDVFNQRVNAVEFIFEQIRTDPDTECLPHGCCIENGMFRRLVKRFTNASTHIAKGDFTLRFGGNLED